MNIQILHSWLLEHLETKASPQKVGESLALCGPSVEKVEKHGNDWLYDIEVTTNRIDMMSVIGIAREATVILPQFGYKATPKPLTLNRKALLKKEKGKNYSLTIETNKNLTNRVMAVVMDVTMGKTPDWIKERLEAAGIRSLNPVIDVTNYVMTEIGHPTHVFDYDRIKSHTLIFRLSKKGEKITTLDEKTYELPGGDSVIDDGTGTIVDLPGIMGTENSVVTDKTKRIIFFIDNNDPVLMRKTSMTLGIRTVAATLNEKRVDPELAEVAMLRGIEIYKKICQAHVVSKLYDIYPNKPKIQVIKVSLEFINNRLGVELKAPFVKKILEGLGFTTTQTTGKNPEFTINVPSWRTHDVQIPEDIVEEVARIYGYFNLPSRLPTGEIPQPSSQQQIFYWEKVVKNALKHWGFFETYTYSLVSKEMIALFNQDPEKHLKIRNPLTTEWEYLRRSLVPSLLQTLAKNQDKTEKLQLFELANVYEPQEGELPKEKLMLCVIESGDVFLHTKGIAEALGKELGISFTFSPSGEEEFLESILQAKITVKGKGVGVIGRVTNEMTQKFGLKEPATLCYLDFEALVLHATKNKAYTPLPKYPPIIENLTFFNEGQVPVASILKAGKQVSPLVHQIKVVDFYENKINLEIAYLDRTKNLTSEEVTPMRRKLIVAIEKLGLTLQGAA